MVGELGASMESGCEKDDAGRVVGFYERHGRGVAWPPVRGRGSRADHPAG